MAFPDCSGAPLQCAGQQHLLDCQDHSTEACLHKVARYPSILLHRQRMGEAVARIENVGDGTLAAAGDEGTAAIPSSITCSTRLRRRTRWRRAMGRDPSVASR